MVILRIGALSRYLVLRSLHRTPYLTQRELEEVYRVEPIYYGYEYPTLLLVIVICFTYACISPVILIFGALYFSGALMVYKVRFFFDSIQTLRIKTIFFSYVTTCLIETIKETSPICVYTSLRERWIPFPHDMPSHDCWSHVRSTHIHGVLHNKRREMSGEFYFSLRIV